jgi:hypothetical protein
MPWPGWLLVRGEKEKAGKIGPRKMNLLWDSVSCGYPRLRRPVSSDGGNTCCASRYGASLGGYVDCMQWWVAIIPVAVVVASHEAGCCPIAAFRCDG